MKIQYKLVKRHIDNISAGDAIHHDGKIRTVSPEYIKRGGFCGTTVFGDSYHSGHKPVFRLERVRG